MRFPEARSRLLASLRSSTRDERVVDAMGRTPRERFVDERLRGLAYADRALPIGRRQSISQPSIVALMTEALESRPGDVALDVGTGSGYEAAILARLVERVVGVERIPFLARRARRILRDLGLGNVDVHVATGELGWAAGAPYDGIIVAAAAPDVPAPLVDQLGPGGRLVVPVGSMSQQTLVRVVRTARGTRETHLGSCRFVPLVGEGGWTEEEAEHVLRESEG